MADIKQKEAVFNQLKSLADGVEFGATREGDEESLALAKAIQTILTVVKDPERRANLLTALDLVENMPSSANIYEQLRDKI